MNRAATTRGVAWRTIAAFALGVAIALPAGLALGRSGDLISVEASPDGRERLEFYQPTAWQRLVLGYGDHDYAVARLSDATSGETLATSPVIYRNGTGPTIWTAARIDIGMAASFDRTRHRWSLNGSD